ncbi:Zinc finger BED domain-containing protein DAYSLEEPER [Striga hermonthica]|uniref:Zinc finger BED domain-containing protein DAYSLEEPER n=1 Tax=Striga hermonthica TaxID=68872 RepID=A0A9N7R748_STRHE|nr:Zinc finger BED domain-containing protein DAYSLEEPER [Striga hermonthica]
MNRIIFWATVFDPRDKFEFMEYSLSEMYGAEQGVALFESVKNGLFELFTEYERKYQPNVEDDNRGSSSSVSHVIDDFNSEKVMKKPVNRLKARYEKHKLESGSGRIKKTELQVYLDEEVLEDCEDLDVLKWWKINSGRFPFFRDWHVIF